MDFEKNIDIAKEWFHRASTALERTHTAFIGAVSRLFAPAMVVGNPERARKQGELDGDLERLRELNRAWREMLALDPWTLRLRAHVRLLQQVSFGIFLCFVLSGLYLHAKHPIFSVLMVVFFATLPYWWLVGVWHRRTREKVFAEFRKRFGEHFHLE